MPGGGKVGSLPGACSVTSGLSRPLPQGFPALCAPGGGCEAPCGAAGALRCCWVMEAPFTLQKLHLSELKTPGCGSVTGPSAPPGSSPSHPAHSLTKAVPSALSLLRNCVLCC